MQAVQRSSDQETLGRLRPAVLRVLCQVGDIGLPEQETRSCDVGGDCKIQRRTWAGRYFGVRAPEVGETPLSQAEVDYAVKIGFLEYTRDTWPVKRVHKEIGSWEKKHLTHMAKPTPWEGLL